MYKILFCCSAEYVKYYFRLDKIHRIYLKYHKYSKNILYKNKTWPLKTFYFIKISINSFPRNRDYIKKSMDTPWCNFSNSLSLQI